MIRKRRATKPTLYVDTNILSAMFTAAYFLETVHHQMVTREWWATERKHFKIHASAFVEDELTRGTYPGQRTAIACVRSLPYLPATGELRTAARRFAEEKVIPVEKPGDALHLACATVHRIDYLLTWNYAHLANAATQRKLMNVCKTAGWRPPLLVSPETIPKVGLGHEIRRIDDLS